MKQSALVPLALLALALCGCQRPMAAEVAVDADRADALRDALNEKGTTDGGTEVVQAEPKGWATIRGEFRIDGTPPPRRPVAVQGDDTAYCAPGGNIPLGEEVRVGPDGGIRDVLVFLDTEIPDDPKWINPERYDADKTAEVLFDQKQCMFLTHVMAMRSTQTLKIMNSDDVGHNTKLDPRDNSKPFNQIIPPHRFATHQILGPEKQPMPVSCSIHTWMRAYIITRDSPYFDVTDESGQFRIEDVPAGVELEFRVWQEKANFIQSVTVNGQEQRWRRGRFTLTLDPGQEYVMKVVVSASLFQ